MVDNGIHHRSYIKSFRKTIQFASELDFGVDHFAIFAGADASFGFKKRTKSLISFRPTWKAISEIERLVCFNITFASSNIISLKQS
jgi:hypothetical protein